MAEKMVELAEFQDHAAELLRELQAGGVDVVVTEHGRPIARIMPIAGSEPPPAPSKNIPWGDYEQGKGAWAPKR